MPDSYQIEIKGLDRLLAAFKQFPRQVAKAMGDAGDEAAKEILKTRGAGWNYPGKTAANAPPTPYYIRGVGTETAHGNLMNSERLGTKWVVKRERGGWNVRVGNVASYADKVHGPRQVSAMARIGWLKLTDAAEKKRTQVTRTYNRWVKYTLAKLGL